ncbi:MAG: hypothetical protein CML13_12195 [Puniceicoccaceae bacterium]|nr:hypothetical protein [Puniceicoccaceae bacterium]|tara:strand:+ start:3685 stop:4734 length:1050 start_codon:yes stop_codon:yes gene_type:complete
MSRKIILSLLGVLIVATVLIIFFRREESVDESVQVKEVAALEEKPSMADEGSEAVVDSIPPEDWGVDAATQAFLEKSMADPDYEWKQPIKFYGKVVNLDGQPLEGVTVEYGWTALTGYERRTVESDSNGLFDLDDVRGKTMTVKLEKDGYDWFNTRTQRQFEFAEPYDPKFHQGVPGEPLIYYMRERPEAEPLVAHRGKKGEVFTSSGGSFYNYLTGRLSQSAGNNGVIRLTAETDSFDPEQSTNYTWSLTIKGSGVSFFADDTYVTSVAPEQQYVESVQLGSSTQDGANWGSQQSQNIFFRTDDGNYGRLHVMATVRPESEKINIRIDSYFNPSGSRALVFSSKKRIR